MNEYDEKKTKEGQSAFDETEEKPLPVSENREELQKTEERCVEKKRKSTAAIPLRAKGEEPKPIIAKAPPMQLPANEQQEKPVGFQMSLGDHLEELRIRIITSLYALFGVASICIMDQKFYMNIILAPHKKAMSALNLPTTIQVLHYQETFFAYLKVALIAALIMTMPFIIYQAWLFVSAGLYEREKRYFKVFFPIAVLFFFLGVLFGYYVMIPIALRFLGSYGGRDIQVGFTLSSYISLFSVLTFVAGVIFELPLVMLLLNKINIFSTRDYLKQWRHFILAAFAIAAILTPPDAVTQILMAIPMILLYYLGVMLCRLTERMHIIHRFLTNDYLKLEDFN